MAFLVLLFSLFCQSIWAQEINIQPRILGGSPAQDRIGFVVSIQEKTVDGNLHICGGSILKDKWVLTVAHCVSEYNSTNTQLVIMAGANDLGNVNANVQYINVKRICLHPHYHPENETNDLALLELQSSLRNIKNVETIELIDSDTLESAIENRESGQIYGWGATETSVIPRFLYELNVVLRTPRQCKRDIEKLGCHTFDPNIALCTGPAIPSNTFKGAYLRDDGGPLVIDGKLAGVIIHGRHAPSEDQCHTSTIYSKITPSVIDLINYEIDENEYGIENTTET